MHLVEMTIDPCPHHPHPPHHILNIPESVTVGMSENSHPKINWSAHNFYMSSGEQKFWTIYYCIWLVIAILLFFLPSHPIICEIKPKKRKIKWEKSDISRRRSV